MEEREVVLRVIEKFCFDIKHDILKIVFENFVNDVSQMLEENVIPIGYNFESVELQICQRHIIQDRNNYWHLQPTEIKSLESYLSKHKNSLIELKSEIEGFLGSSYQSQRDKFGLIEKEKEQKEFDFVFDILDKDEVKTKKAFIIIRDNKEYPYKSDKVKALLNIFCNVDQIFFILNHWETLVVQRNYVEKYYKEKNG